VLVISHDDRFYEVGDRIIKLDYGKIVSDQPVVPVLTEPSVEFSSKAVASQV
jgi:ABC-type siderophore export system fused ATPase/permease subunit